MIDKPFCMHILPRSFLLGGNKYFSINASIGFSLSQNNRLYAIQDLLKYLSPWIDKVNVLGDGLPIGCGEWLLAGSAHAPSQIPADKWIVSAGLGASKKQLNVYGERMFGRASIQSLKPAIQVPLTWNRCWGGSTVSENPQGCGVRESNGAVIVPSIEYPNFEWTNPETPSKPASMLPIEPKHPLRQKYAGSYGANYLKDFFPGFPDDCSWKYFNLACLDQQIDGYWKGDETFEFLNLHPQYPKIEGSLPELRPRIWVSKRDDILEEIPLQLGRVLFFPEAMIGVVLYQSVIDSNSLDGADIERILGAIESMHDSKQQETFYEDIWQKRTGRNTDSALASLDDSELCSQRYEICFSALDSVFKKGRNKETANRKSREMSERLESMNEEFLAEADKFSDSEAPKKLVQDVVEKMRDSFPVVESDSRHGYGSNISELSQYIKNVREELKGQLHQTTQKKSLLEQSKQSLLDAKKSINDISSQSKQFNPLESSFEKPDIKNELKEGLKRIEEIVLGAPPAGREKEWLDLRKNWERNKEFFTDDSKLHRKGSDFKDQISIIQKMIEDRPKKSNMQGLIEELETLISGVEGGRSEKRFEPLIIEDLKNPHENWPQVGQDYEMYGFRNWNFKKGHLKKLRLTKCSFLQCDLSDSLWEDCIFDSCDLSEINITNASFVNVTFLHCQLRGSLAPKSKWKNSKFIKCEAQFSFWNGSNWEGGSLLHTDLTESVWNESELNQSTMIECNLQQAMFVSLNANRTSWLHCDFTDGGWNKVSLSNSVFYMNKMAKNWRDSNFNKVSLRSANLDGSDFHGATFNSVEFNEADLSNSNLSRIKARNVHFVRAQFNGSDISESTIENSNFLEANLRGTSFADSDLVASWFGNTFVDDATRWQLARTNTSCFYPQRQVD